VPRVTGYLIFEEALKLRVGGPMPRGAFGRWNWRIVDDKSPLHSLIGLGLGAWAGFDGSTRHRTLQTSGRPCK